MNAYVMTGLGAIVNILIPWSALFFIKNNFDKSAWLFATVTYTLSVISVYFDLGFTRYFQVKARVNNIDSYLSVSVKNSFISSFFLSHLSYLLFRQLFGIVQYDVYLHIYVILIVCSGAVAQLLFINYELRGEYKKSILMRALLWLVFFAPVFLSSEIRDALFLGVICRSFIVIIIVISLRKMFRQEIKVFNFYPKKNEIIYFGGALLFGMLVERLWPRFIVGEDVKAAALMVIDIASKVTFFSGIIGQAAVNRLFADQSSKLIGIKYVHVIASVSVIILLLMLQLINSYMSMPSLGVNVLIVLIVYTYFQSADQIVVILGQRMVSEKKLVRWSLISLCVIGFFAIFGIVFQSSFVVVSGLAIKSIFEYLIYSRRVA